MKRLLYGLLGFFLLGLFLAGDTAFAQMVEYRGGKAWNDERTQTMTLSFTGGAVTGTILTTPVCRQPNPVLWGGTFAISAQLLGPWEDRGSVIRGTWSGTVDTCGGSSFPDGGEVEISMAADPFNNLSVRVVFSSGSVYVDRYGFYYTPLNKVFVSGPSQSVEASYPGGQAWLDERGQSMRLNFAGERVWGDLDTQSICNSGAALGGIYQRLDGTLRGNWEGWGSLIFGTWGGDNRMCDGATIPDRGHMCIFLGRGRQDEPAIIVRSIDENGQTYHYSYTSFQNKLIDLGLSPAANAAGGVQSQLLYEGKSWRYGINDGRTQTLAMGIQGDRVFGSMNVPSYCTDKANLNGGAMQFEAALDGPWEAPGTTMIGWWSGYKYPCAGGQIPDSGTLRISMGTTPDAPSGVIVQIVSLDGTEYAYYHPAKGQVATGFAGAADRFFGDAFQLCNFPLPGAPRSSEICEYVDDGQCDEPGVGTGRCPAGSDVADCGAGSDTANSCDLSFDGVCDEPDDCAPGTDTADCQSVDQANTCVYAHDGMCDEPNNCQPGTDTADCQAKGDDSCAFARDGVCDEPGNCDPGTDATDCGATPGDLANSCPRANNGQCEEPSGACAPGTDTADCQNQPTDLANSCPFANNGQCDVPSGACAAGTDTADCGTTDTGGGGGGPDCTAFWNGTWNSSYGDMTISAGGGSASGSYTTRDTEPAAGQISGTLSTDGCTLTGKWDQSATPNHDAKSGDFSFTIASDGKSWSGGWNYASGGGGGGWSAERIGQ